MKDVGDLVRKALTELLEAMEEPGAREAPGDRDV
jgi:hypothetical protein